MVKNLIRPIVHILHYSLLNHLEINHLIFDIGTKFEYSNSNYVLLGYIIENISGMKYEDYIEKNIFKPLKLKNTGTLRNQTVIKNKAMVIL